MTFLVFHWQIYVTWCKTGLSLVERLLKQPSRGYWLKVGVINYMLWRWPNCMTIWHVMCSKRKRQRHHHDGDRAGGRGRVHLHPLRHPRALLQVRQPARELLSHFIGLIFGGSSKYVANWTKIRLEDFVYANKSLKQIKWLF